MQQKKVKSEESSLGVMESIAIIVMIGLCIIFIIGLVIDDAPKNALAVLVP